jgi:hypothetical protein
MKSQTVPYVHRRLTVFLYLIIHINPPYIWMMFSDWVTLTLPVFVLINVYPGHTTCISSIIVGRERHCPINWYNWDVDTIRNSKGQMCILSNNEITPNIKKSSSIVERHIAGVVNLIARTSLSPNWCIQYSWNKFYTLEQFSLMGPYKDILIVQFPC